MGNYVFVAVKPQQVIGDPFKKGEINQIKQNKQIMKLIEHSTIVLNIFHIIIPSVNLINHGYFAY